MTELHGLQSSIEEFESRGVRLIAISPDPIARNREVVTRLGLEFPVLSDTEALAIAAFGVEHPGGGPGGSDIVRPASFILVDGQVRWRDLTDNWRVRPRPGEILLVLDELG
jgi:peroxiredoxin